ncbi:MAG: glycosyl hydrolase [Dysgonamonadaceae bacterium]|jgi:hypothetical protein|nr:glycosyl hydrolase [Dysgonamonadaceae bacterium]
MANKIGVLKIALALGLAICSSCSSTKTFSDEEGRVAVGATTFLNSIGAVSSVSRRGETIEGSIECVKYTGLRWLRCGFEDDAPLEDFLSLHREVGTVFSYGLLSGHSDIRRLLDDAEKLAQTDALLAIEGANEPNNWGISYEGEKGGGGDSWLPIAKLHRDLYAAVKNNAVLKDYPVWATCETGAQTDNTGLQFLTIPEGADSLLMPAGTKYADYANCHNYISHPSWQGLHDNQTWLSSDPGQSCPVDGLYGNFGQTWAKKFRGYTDDQLIDLPKVTTETGYHVKPGDSAVTEEIQARLYLNLYLSQFKRGWAYTAVYLLKTRQGEPEHEGFAFYTVDYQPRKAAHYLHNFTAILNDDKMVEIQGKLNYGIADQPETTHDLLLQKSNGHFMLVLWGERFASGGADNIRVDLGRARKNVRIFDPTIGTEAIGALKNVRSVEVSLTDHPMIIEIF